MAEMLRHSPYILTNKWQFRNFAVWSVSGQTFSEGVRVRTQNIIYSTNVCPCPFVIILHNTQFSLYGRGQNHGAHSRKTLNKIGAIVSTPHICLKFPTSHGIVTIHRDQKLGRSNSDLFAWKASDMPDISPEAMSHKVSVYLGTRPIQHRKRKMSEE
ncbi:hypothetical protein PIB30_022378 [Stylosanthes scabra]|uniref:Uncharacterized protein n=1 Tax=Stylosanthes scabra TaxID=79078 RepID=A0ABU6XAX0_9FABA|nr:hypothetical protein [Stylosanthes scabra]